MSRNLKPAPKVGILVTPEVEVCCAKWTDAYILPYWSHTNLIADSTDGMEVPKYCPGCRRKLHHTREFDVMKEVKHIPRGIKHPYPIRKEPTGD